MSIVISDSQAEDIINFIDHSLDSQWDRHTDLYICTDKWEDGKRRMNPAMYALMERLQELLVAEE